MDMAQVEAFLSVAEELHFGRAAQRLRVSQPRVSRLVATLERQVGGKLFERTSRRVMLTPLGQQFLAELEPGYAQMRAAFGHARRAARETAGALRIGCTAFVAGPGVSRLVEEFSARQPGCEVTLHEVRMWEPYAALRCGEIDVLVNWLVVDEPDLTAGVVLEYRDRVLAVGRGHRLAARESVSAEDLAGEETHELASSYPAALGDAIMPRSTPSGRPIRRSQPAHGADHVLTLIARCRIVHPTMASIPLFVRDDITLIPIHDLPPMPLGLVWRTAHENAKIRALADAARQLGPLSANGRRREPITSGSDQAAPA
jgi:DNA-binding transcriptional LysR family regulator